MPTPTQLLDVVIGPYGRIEGRTSQRRPGEVGALSAERDPDKDSLGAAEPRVIKPSGGGGAEDRPGEPSVAPLNFAPENDVLSLLNLTVLKAVFELLKVAPPNQVPSPPNVALSNGVLSLPKAAWASRVSAQLKVTLSNEVALPLNVASANDVLSPLNVTPRDLRREDERLGGRSPGCT
jgi:hypothetical protein